MATRADEPVDPDHPRARRPSTGAVLLWVVGLTALILVLGLLTGTGVRLIGLVVFLPAFAAAFTSVRQTVLTACWSAVVVALSLVYRPAPNRSDDIVALTLTVIFGALSVLGCRYRIRHENEMLRLRSTATAMQRSILRPLPLLTDQVLMDGVYEPLQEDKLVGGDIYDLAASPYGTRVLIGDVQGKGLPAIGTAFAVIGAFREAAYRERTLSGLVDALEEAVVRHNAIAAEADEPERFVTALVLCIDDSPTVQAISCGHPLPYLVGPGATVSVLLEEADLPLGLGSLTPVPRTVGRFHFPFGTTLLLCTDGLTEARAPDGTFFPLEKRLAEAAGLPPAQLARSLHTDSRAFSAGHQQDDIAVLALRRAHAAGGAPAA
ncbi:PP2C family protein-serine/threonine phosphatase [Streptomyces scopuliridis]|uniref:PP2C family protein-serine/threonine phosphatase n=1 Tax=Streptomyces scopuliridis TaxID=452529 RepID=UPI00342B0020